MHKIKLLVLVATELIDQVNDLFCKHYQNLVDEKLTKNYQIVYQPELLELAVTNFDSENNTLATKMLQEDLQARREAYADSY